MSKNKIEIEKVQIGPGRKKKKIYYLLGIVGIILSIISICFLSEYYVIMFGGVK